MTTHSLLDFTISFFEEMRIHTYFTDAPYTWMDQYDLGLRSTLLKKQDCLAATFPELDENFHTQNHVYIIRDLFQCYYLSIPVPYTEHKTVFFAGPFAFKAPKRDQIQQLMEQLQIPEQHSTFLIQYYSSLPVIHDKGCLRSFLHCLCSRLYGKEGFSISSLSQTNHIALHYETQESTGKNKNVTESIEKRYDAEEAMMDAIAHGDYEKAKENIHALLSSAPEQRLPDTIRDRKNFLIILNTLCRKATQRGKVHPVYLDELSRKLAFKLENLNTLSQLDAFPHEALRKYSLLVRSYSTQGYSLAVQKVVNYISLNLQEDLSLDRLAEIFSLNKSYLSSLFRRETGQTLTDFVIQKRMEHAICLLNTTPTSIQEIAARCGILDLSYFTKLFRRTKGMTPSQYRSMVTKRSGV
ncbi:AraC family transcriptional regulator [Clostridium sp.]|uniref:helix-turn-helix transcriptional regulator n=1 Tax=Clostridium sp. TaxID=1506 RepID=UPI0025912BE7|nr:AraC family transcriptional regulator [Clostridium sp.]MCI6139822.1 AraC family transcriptional regulator [Clostridium sp.]